MGDDSDSVASAKVLYDTMRKAVMNVACDVIIPDIDTKIDHAVARELANASVVSENSLRGRHVGIVPLRVDPWTLAVADRLFANRLFT